jgi:hypothetical protein
MKRPYYILFISLFLISCSQKNQEYQKNSNTGKEQNHSMESVEVNSDTLEKGDTFITGGPAGKTYQKEGRIVMIADSDKTMPVKMVDNRLMALRISDSTFYPIKQAGNQTMLVLPDSDIVVKDERMMLITDEGESLKVKIVGGHLVVITSQNTMLPLEKKL